MPFVLAAFCDHPTLQQRGDDIALIFIEQASDIGHVEPVVEKEVANRNASLGLGIEIHAVSRHIKFSLTHLEAISSSFTVSLFHLDTFEKRPKFHGNQNRERIAFYRRQRGAPLPAPGGRQAERQDDDGEELKKRLPNPARE
jgi:hypothetical protein